MQASLYRDPPFLQKRLRRYEVKGCVFYTVVVEKGRFWMGDDDSEYDDEKPAHPVDIRHDYELGVQPVTQALWRAVMGSDPEELYFAGDERPVEGVSWDDIRGRGGFLEKLNDLLLQDAQGAPFCLPTEAQWEYAARGGRLHPHAGQLYAGSSRLDEVGWYAKNSGRETHVVGQKQRNVLGLSDMSGNVWEWVEDDWHDNYDKAPLEEASWTESPRGHGRVLRGGGWSFDPDSCRVSFRFYFGPGFRNSYVGFRLARSSSSL